ncbi:MAG TPA: hypothetical protein VE934_13710 [Polaromonas sp.]|uniref:hypothetical protein n=1 Tax=Polaromonas sp. TaxID=1869339 RepID=UPI002D716F6F|nr:hypothetical protein [Polaromonas sp.]HYW58015.1 hypothetical protein [Polaromonas sp.]
MVQYLAQGSGQAIEDAVVLREALRHTHGDVAAAFQKYQQARYLRTARVQLTSRFYGDIYHAAGVQRELRNQLFWSGNEAPALPVCSGCTTESNLQNCSNRVLK